ncbi:acetylornithine deacetylase [Pseudooceanicola sp.]|uniref:acetylornithine deacetylase n=1 Tax=Pseudooceanicola sp. TaxID=1914328 RepID=UPI00262951F3|nr:acetylornithine deacetylase [Pseudooceanicola sp.]MDF1856329.1 acetylornithine deacetylase [Pseudooceanicola sp.]
MSDLATTTAILADLIAHPTVSSEANTEVIAHMATRLEDAGARVEVMLDATGQKANLFASIGPEEPGGIMLSGHSDVVPVEDQPWTGDPFAMWQEGDRLYGRGSCDMKGFLAACIASAPLFNARKLTRPVHFAFTHDEEIGCLGAQSLADVLKDRVARPALAIVGEPTSMRIVEGHKGCCEYRVTFTGVEGHGSRPEMGVNAAEFAARYVTRLLELRETLRHRTPPDSRFEPPWTTINIGRLSGGHAPNVIPGLAEVEWEMRPVQKTDADFVKRLINGYAEDILLPEMQRVATDASIVTEVLGEVAGLQPADRNAALAIVAELTGANGADLVAFGTEAGLYQDIGMDVVVCGPGSIEQAHKPDEYLETGQLTACLDMLSGLADRLTAHG